MHTTDSIPHEEPCSSCAGTGMRDGNDELGYCRACNGSGYHPHESATDRTPSESRAPSDPTPGHLAFPLFQQELALARNRRTARRRRNR